MCTARRPLTHAGNFGEDFDAKLVSMQHVLKMQDAVGVAGEGWQDEGVQTAAARLAVWHKSMFCAKELRWISAAACAWCAARHW